MPHAVLSGRPPPVPGSKGRLDLSWPNARVSRTARPRRHGRTPRNIPLPPLWQGQSPQGWGPGCPGPGIGACSGILGYMRGDRPVSLSRDTVQPWESTILGKVWAQARAHWLGPGLVHHSPAPDPNQLHLTTPNSGPSLNFLYSREQAGTPPPPSPPQRGGLRVHPPLATALVAPGPP